MATTSKTKVSESEAEFMRLINEGGLGTVVKMPGNCQATHAYKKVTEEGDGNDRENIVMPLKFYVENEGKWCFGRSKYEGVLVCWVHSRGKVFITTTEEITFERMKNLKFFQTYEKEMAGFDDLAAYSQWNCKMKHDFFSPQYLTLWRIALS